MTKPLEMYRGVAIYEVTQPKISDEEILGSKVIAKVVNTDQENLQIDFKEEAANREEAVIKIKKKIDHYLDKNDLKKFE